MPIRVLDKQISELIAAGEVIERPASIVKELMENSIDAGATAVTVEIAHGGITYIRVTDNGCGIAHDEAPTAFLRHATSKVSTEEDLTAIKTLGFRGEALASVCAVSKTEMLTKRSEDVFGTRVYIEGAEQLDFSEAGCANGTTVIVRDLFYNVPARLKFMKKDVAETSAVTTAVGQIAMSHPEISVKFIKDNHVALHTPGNSKLLSAIFAVLGRDYAENLMEAEYTYNGVKVSGFVSDPMHGRKSRIYQHFFVNGRYVKSKVGAFALEEAYKNSIMVGKFPACVLCIELDADRTDVNVHPAKTEIRFTDEREVYDAVYFAVKTALSSNNSIAAIAHKQDMQKQEVLKAIQQSVFNSGGGKQLSVGGFASVSTDKTRGEAAHSASEKSKSILSERIIPEDEDGSCINNPNRVSDDNRVLYSASAVREHDDYVFINPDKLKTDRQPDVGDAMHTQDEQTAVSSEENEPQEIPKPVRVVGEIFGTFILAVYDGVFVIIDKHAAHERIIFEELRKRHNNNSQMLLAPITITLSPKAHAGFVENLSVARDMGFEAEDFGGETVLVRAVPTVLEPYNIVEIVEEMAENFSALKKSPEPSDLEELYHSVACKAAVRANDKNSSEELSELANRVCTDEAIRYCPHGRPVVITMTEYELRKKFGR